MSTTDRSRIIAWLLFAAVVLSGLVGWFTGLDPADIIPLLTATAAGAGIGEASNVGKRATFKSEAVDS